MTGTAGAKANVCFIMVALLVEPREHLFLLMSLTIGLLVVFLSQFVAGLWNLVLHSRCKRSTRRRFIFNLYLIHHLIICIIRCLIVFLACISILITDQCLAIEFPMHFLLLLSTFDLLLIIIGETVHFWDSAINRRSTLHSKSCLIFGMFFNYFVSSLFLSIHMTMSGENPVLIELCQINRKRFFLRPTTNDERSLMPTIITYLLFILLDLLTLSWIYISYRDILNLKQKRLVTLFFHSLVFTRFKEHERLMMVNQSLKRLRTIALSVLSNMIVILPVLTIKIFDISLTKSQRLFVLYLTTLPWFDSLAFIFYRETQLTCLDCCSKRSASSEDFYRRQRIGRRLSSYRENKRVLPSINET